MNTANQDFDFLREVGKEGIYNLLFPPPSLGLAIMSLYMNARAGLYANGRFKEAEAVSALEAARVKLKLKPYDRTPNQSFLGDLSLLQAYFLRYDEDLQVYSLRDYAYTFCERAFEVLQATFNPTEIEVICRSLHKELIACTTPKDLAAWANTHFNTFKPRMKQQVDYLDRQIDVSVTEIRRAMRAEESSILIALKEIENKLDHIRKQNGELRSAFDEMSQINVLLVAKLEGVTEPALADLLSTARQFFPEVKYGLGLIDKRLDRIHPKLRLFFNTLSKPAFKIKTENFLHYLLQHSTVITEKSQKAVRLPEEIPLYVVRETAPHFTMVERRGDLFARPARPLVQREINTTQIQKERSLLQAKLNVHRKVDGWVDRICNRLQSEETINFSEVFFQIVGESDGNLELGIRVGYALLKASVIQRRLKVITTTIPVCDSAYKDLRVWEMKLQSIT